MLLSSFVLLEEDFLQVPIEDETLVSHRLSYKGQGLNRKFNHTNLQKEERKRTYMYFYFAVSFLNPFVITFLSKAEPAAKFL